MKLNLNITDMAFMKAILDRTPFTNTTIAKVIYTKFSDGILALQVKRAELVSKNEVEVEKEQEIGGKKGMMKVKEIPAAKTQEVQKLVDTTEIEIEVGGIIYPALKRAVHNFANIAIDPDSGEKGIKGEGDIIAYENLKEKFL